MPDRPFEYEVTFEELSCVGRKRRFDEAIDDEDEESLEVVCRRGGEEIPLAKPSRAFYFGDRNLYDQEARRYDQDEKSRILNTDRFRDNLQVFEELKRARTRGFVMPFVGAGMSKSAGLADWKEYLLSKAGIAGLEVEAVRMRLEVEGDYERVMDEIVDRLTPSRFARDFERDFRIPASIDGAIASLPELFDSCVVTTNFDRVLEQVYENAGKAFVEKVTGRSGPSAFFRAVPAGERYLLKLHGNVDKAAERVLTAREYSEAYGSEGNVNMTFPLPKMLRRLFLSYSFLFLGCSMTIDRSLQVFMRTAGEEGIESIPNHYALLQSPSDDDLRQQFDRRLADAHITPLWYPEGQHEYVETILQLLID